MKSWVMGRISTLIFALFYVLLAGQLSASEGVTLILPVLAAVCLTVGLHRVAERRFAARAPWLRLIFRSATSIAKDTAKVGLFLVKEEGHRAPHLAGRMIEEPFRIGGNSSRDATRRALVTIAVSASPDRYLINLELKDRYLAHALVGDTAASDPEWPV